MSVHKRTYRGGKTVWGYVFNAPNSTPEDRRQITASGFTTKAEAKKAEALRIVEEERKYELEKLGSPVAPAPPQTLATLLGEFFRQHVDVKLAQKTASRYHEQVTYLDRALLDTPLSDITALHLDREWRRLLESGGHHRRTKEPRPLSAKTVANIAGMVSSAFARAIRWGLVTANPVSNSELPRVRQRLGIALTIPQQDLLIKSASGPWCVGVFLEMAAGLGARRGEILALRWSDIVDGRAVITRSLTQTKQGLSFKGTKTERPRVVKIPESTLAKLEEHQKQQDAFRVQYGPDYKLDLDLIFANPDGTPLRPDSVSSAVSLLFRRLKLPKGASLHSLRHTHTSHLLASGVPLPVVAARLGHSSVRTTQEIYAHMIHGQDDEAAKAWENLQRQNEPAKVTKAGDVQ